MKTLQGFNHRPGIFCITSAIRDIVEFNNHQKFDEDFIFGLSSGMFFAYTSIPKFSAIAGAAGDLVTENFCANITAKKIDEYSQDDEHDWEQLKYFVDNNLPVIVESNIDGVAEQRKMSGTGLQEQDVNATMQDELGLPMNYHNIIIIGYDEDKETVRFVDNRVDMEISRELLYKTRAKDRKRSYFLLPDKIDHLRERVYNSIHRCADYWLRMPENPKKLADRYTARHLKINDVKNTMEGLDQFRENYLRPHAMKDPEFLQWTLFMLGEYSYRAFGGDMTRGMYARYLQRGYEITNDAGLLTATAMYKDLSREWRSFFKWFAKDREQVIRLLQDPEESKIVFDAIERIYEKEKEAIFYLDTIKR